MDNKDEAKNLRLQIIETMGWKKGEVTVPGLLTKKTATDLFGVFHKPMCQSTSEGDHVTHLYLSQNDLQQIIVLVTENRFFSPKNIGQLCKKSNVTLTTFENGHAIYHDKKALKTCNYNENFLRLVNQLFKSMNKDDSYWPDSLCQDIRKTLIEGIKIEKERWPVGHKQDMITLPAKMKQMVSSK